MKTVDPVKPSTSHRWLSGIAVGVVLAAAVGTVTWGLRGDPQPLGNPQHLGEVLPEGPAVMLPAPADTAAECAAPALTATPSPTPTASVGAQPAVGADASAWLRTTASTLAAARSDDETGRYAHTRRLGWYTDMYVGSDGIGRTEVRLQGSEGWYGDDGSATVTTITYQPGTTRPAPDQVRATAREHAFAGDHHTLFAGPPSADARQLCGQLAQSQSPEVGPQWVMRAIAGLATEYHLPRPVRAALLRVLSTTAPRWDGPVTDRTGRSGVAVSIDPDSLEHDTLILDPATGAVLAYHEVQLANPGKLTGPFPQDRSYEAFLHNGRSDSIPPAE